MSPNARHEYDGTHRASLQFHEQHCIPSAQASPSVPQVDAPVTALHVPELVDVPLQIPEQHCASLVHGTVEAVPSRFVEPMHSVLEHRPPVGDDASA